jgi:hypothetical protein
MVIDENINEASRTSLFDNPLFYEEHDLTSKEMKTLSCDAKTMMDFVICNAQTMTCNDVVWTYDAQMMLYEVVMIDEQMMTEITCVANFKCKMMALIALKSTLGIRWTINVEVLESIN